MNGTFKAHTSWQASLSFFIILLSIIYCGVGFEIVAIFCLTYLFAHLLIEVHHASLLVLTGELPVGVIKMKVQGAKVILSDNIGLTLPANIDELGDVKELDLRDCSLTGMV
jgi:hypothetical protein